MTDVSMTSVPVFYTSINKKEILLDNILNYPLTSPYLGANIPLISLFSVTSN
jgi:hypothetical protein